jgi:2-dehydro-3-deoxyphosphogluconate aldolase/(4S)-4-hydroxy-2-oxoglutarate aldolase
MQSSQFFNHHLADQPVIAIFRGYTPDQTVGMALKAWESGVRLVEVPIQNEAGRRALTAVAEVAREKGLPFGAGTVLNVGDVEFAQEQGCSFTVAPGLDIDICRATSEAGLAHLPGVASSSEVGLALAHGYTWLKAFPARELSPGWITAQLGPFPTICFVATGGVSEENAEEFFEAGARAIGVGAAVGDPHLLEVVSRARRKEMQ